VQTLGASFRRLGFEIVDRDFERGENAIRLPGVQWPSRCSFIAALAFLERFGEAKRAVTELLSFRPDISQSFVRNHLATIEHDDKEHLLDGLRAAGLPRTSVSNLATTYLNSLEN
jgi:hypothetical protein